MMTLGSRDDGIVMTRKLVCSHQLTYSPEMTVESPNMFSLMGLTILNLLNIIAKTTPVD